MRQPPDSGRAEAVHLGPSNESATATALVSGLSVPHLPDGCDTLTAALAYAEAGHYVVPIRRGTKDPGSVVGQGWPAKSTRDPEQIVARWAGTDHGVALHVGRSGVVAFDLDHPERVPEALAKAIRASSPPRQRTRRTGARGHVLFAMPQGRTLGNSTGGLGKDWGQVRGANGVLAVYPTEHPEPDGEYAWLRTGPVPVLDADVAALLPDAGPAADAATDQTVVAFLAEHRQACRPGALAPALDRFAALVRTGGSRHEAAVEVACWLARESAADYYPAPEAFDALEAEFTKALDAERPAGPEFAGIVAWAIGQVTPEQVAAKRAALHPAETGDAAPEVDFLAGTGSAAATSQVAPVASWAGQDLTAVLDGTYAPLEPTLLPRTDRRCLLYAGLVHGLHGESESGKSLLAQAEVARCLQAGLRVVYIDYESNASTVVGRLLLMSVTREAIRRHLVYVRPERSPADPAERDAWRALLDEPAALVVIDGVTEALTTMGRSTVDNDEVTLWFRQVPRAIAQATGAAVVLVDHVTKSTEGRGRFAIGAQAKMSALDGASYAVEVVQPLGRGMRGVLRLWVGKDREGGVRPYCGRFRPADRAQLAATVVVDSTAGPITVEVQPPDDLQGTPARPFRPTGFMERLSRALEGRTEPLPGNALVRRSDLVTGKAEHKAKALDVLVTEGYVQRRQTGQALLHTSLRPYREAEDTASQPGVGSTASAPTEGPTPTPSLGVGSRESVPAAHQPPPGVGRESVGVGGAGSPRRTAPDAHPGAVLSGAASAPSAVAP